MFSRWTTWAILLAAMALAAGCGRPGPAGGAPGEPRPPDATVFLGERSLQPVKGSFCWRSGNRGLCADTPAPWEMGLPAWPARPGQTVQYTVHHDRAPAAGTWQVWQGKGEEVAGGSLPAGLQGEFRLPERPGDYTVQLHLQWPGVGDGTYLFRVSTGG